MHMRHMNRCLAYSNFICSHTYNFGLILSITCMCWYCSCACAIPWTHFHNSRTEPFVRRSKWNETKRKREQAEKEKKLIKTEITFHEFHLLTWKQTRFFFMCYDRNANRTFWTIEAPNCGISFHVAAAAVVACFVPACEYSLFTVLQTSKQNSNRMLRCELRIFWAKVCWKWRAKMKCVRWLWQFAWLWHFCKSCTSAYHLALVCVIVVVCDGVWNIVVVSCSSHFQESCSLSHFFSLRLYEFAPLVNGCLLSHCEYTPTSYSP